ncbi:hypothetical protein ACFC0L_32980, partial [Streptomyces brevispora]
GPALMPDSARDHPIETLVRSTDSMIGMATASYSGSQTAHSKDGVETKLKNAVCAGTITLSSARSAIKTNWTTALQVTGIG